MLAWQPPLQQGLGRTYSQCLWKNDPPIAAQPDLTGTKKNMVGRIQLGVYSGSFYLEIFKIAKSFTSLKSKGARGVLYYQHSIALPFACSSTVRFCFKESPPPSKINVGSRRPYVLIASAYCLNDVVISILHLLLWGIIDGQHFSFSFSSSYFYFARSTYGCLSLQNHLSFVEKLQK